MNKTSCQQWEHRKWSSVCSGISADIHRYLTRSEEDSAKGQGFIRQLSAWLSAELMCLSIYRVSHFLHVGGWYRTANLLSALNCLLHKVRIPAGSCIGPGCRLSHPSGVVFEGIAGRNLTIFSYAICMGDRELSRSIPGLPELKNNITLGAHSVLCGDIHIGNEVQISPGSVVRHDIPDNVIVASYKLFTATHIRKESGQNYQQGNS